MISFDETCVCNVWNNPCANELANMSVIVKWFLLGLSALSQLLSPLPELRSLSLTRDNMNKTWMYFPDGDGKPHQAVIVATTYKIEMPQTIKVEFYISANEMTSCDFVIYKSEVIANDDFSQKFEKFNPKLNTKVLTHGFLSATSKPVVQLNIDGYMKQGQLNVFGINWENQANPTLSVFSYKSVAEFTKHVGRAVAKFLDLLVEQKGANPNLIHLMGHSLGAHVMGYAGKYTKYPVNRITGFDPARPSFENCVGTQNHLYRTDAKTVDVIHTSKILGFHMPIGLVDFYPNRDKSYFGHPDCWGIKLPLIGKITEFCDHSRAYEFFAESINSKKGFHSVPCTSMEAMESRNCKGKTALMGDPTESHAKGIYILRTAGGKPSFALGEAGAKTTRGKGNKNLMADAVQPANDDDDNNSTIVPLDLIL